MKKLILVRHGKSSWKHDLPDEERPLKKRAYRDAQLVLGAFKAVADRPLTIWSSYAARALGSAKIFKKELSIEDRDFHVKKELYTFDSNQLLKEIRSCKDAIDQLMVFGHNPAMTELVNYLGDKHFENIPTTGLTVIEFEHDSWKTIGNGAMLLYLFPKNLK